MELFQISFPFNLEMEKIVKAIITKLYALESKISQIEGISLYKLIVILRSIPDYKTLDDSLHEVMILLAKDLNLNELQSGNVINFFKSVIGIVYNRDDYFLSSLEQLERALNDDSKKYIESDIPISEDIKNQLKRMINKGVLNYLESRERYYSQIITNLWGMETYENFNEIAVYKKIEDMINEKIAKRVKFGKDQASIPIEPTKKLKCKKPSEKSKGHLEKNSKKIFKVIRMIYNNRTFSKGHQLQPNAFQRSIIDSQDIKLNSNYEDNLRNELITQCNTQNSFS